MCRALRVRWTITPKTAPRPWIACSGCGGLKAFQSSGKIRLNANGRKLDAWLIYKCVDCEKTWNRPLFERRNLRDIDPSVLEALQSNDPEWIRAEAFNLDALRRKSQRIDEFSEYDILKDVVYEAPCWAELQIALTVPLQVGTRLDRLLASELAVSRTRLQELHDLGRLRIDTQRSDALRRHIRTGTVASFDLSPEPDRERLWRSRATGAVL